MRARTRHGRRGGAGVAAGLLCAALAAGVAAGESSGAGPDLGHVDFDAVVVHGAGEGTLAAGEVLDVDVELARLPGGWGAPRAGLPARGWPLRELGGARVRLHGSALDAVAAAVERAHARRGHARVRVAVRPGAVRTAAGQRPLVIELHPDGVPVGPAHALPAAPDRLGRDAILVSVRALDIAGPPDLGVSPDALLAVDVELSWDATRIPAGYVAPRRGLAVQSIGLWRLGRGEPRGVPLYGSAIQAILQAVGEALYARGVHDVSVDLDPGAIRRLATPGGDGLLLLRVDRR